MAQNMEYFGFYRNTCSRLRCDITLTSRIASGKGNAHLISIETVKIASSQHGAGSLRPSPFQ